MWYQTVIWIYHCCCQQNLAKNAVKLCENILLIERKTHQTYIRKPVWMGKVLKLLAELVFSSVYFVLLWRVLFSPPSSRVSTYFSRKFDTGHLPQKLRHICLELAVSVEIPASKGSSWPVDHDRHRRDVFWTKGLFDFGADSTLSSRVISPPFS